MARTKLKVITFRTTTHIYRMISQLTRKISKDKGVPVSRSCVIELAIQEMAGKNGEASGS